ncbi:hypothetical protein MILUP08_43376 [Micromonospora lupini str. Lupac 08]|uniref:Uncharacterized protein n=1 Tax=Micromonospora lupini str. Lupac 08 TaxID=1150864 RepID=I0L3R9_9ACTN|nr:hypothetical protein MILUP08_43376 [Micromonospora lupini str. Lupac 08]
MLVATLAVAQTPARAGAAAATAPSASATVTGARATIHGRVSTDADAAASAGNAYWTPERMRAARPPPCRTGSTPSTGRPPTVPAESARPGTWRRRRPHDRRRPVCARQWTAPARAPSR